MAGRRLRILELSTEGQVQRWFIDPLAAYLRNQGHEVRQVNGADLSLRRHISGFDLVALIRLWWRLRRWRIDVLHVQTAKAGAVGRVAAWLAGTKRVVYTAHDFPFHDDLPPWRYRLYVWIEWLLAKTCQAITVDSAAVKNRGLQIAPAYKIQVIPVGVDTEKFSPDPKAPQHGPATVGTVSRLVPEKGLEQLIRAVQWVHPRPRRCLIVGEGPSLESLRQVASWSQATLFEFVGAQEEVRPYLQQMDIFVLPTRREGLSVAVMEAMSMGLPVLVSDIPAFEDLVIHRETGLKAKDHEFVMWLSYLLRNHDERTRLGMAARVHVQKYYEQSASHRAYERVLTGVA